MNKGYSWAGFICLLVIPCIGFSQKKFGFEWINSSQVYYRFPLVETGIYRIDYQALVNSGINLSTIDPRNIQLFQRGEELPVYIKGESDSSFDQGDFIEFYAKKNDGYFDKKIYSDSNNHYNPYVSIVSDTAYVFLTFNTSVGAAPLRLTDYNNTNYGSFTPEPYYLRSQRQIFSNEYFYGTPIVSAYDYHSSEYLEGEGWASTRFGKGIGDKTISFNTFGYVNSGPAPTCKLRFSGVSDYGPVNPDHHQQVKFSPDNSVYSVLIDTIFEGYSTLSFNLTLSQSIIGVSDTYIRFTNVDNTGSAVDAGVIPYVELTYPATTDLIFSDNLEFEHTSTSTATDVLFNFSRFTGTLPFIYDLTGKTRIEGNLNAGNVRFLYKKISGANKLVIFDTADVKRITQLSLVSFPVIDTAVKYEYLIVTNKTLLPKATEYAQYRSQKYNVLLVTNEQLANYYTHGINHPLAIRSLADHLLSSGVNPEFLLLIGRGLQQEFVRLPQHSWLNLVPQIGVPSSDVMFTAGLNGTLYEPAIPTGRIPAITNQDIDNYLQKVKAMETNPDSIQLWRKQILHLGGGEGAGQQLAIASSLNNNRVIAQGAFGGASVTSYFKSTTNPVDVNLKQNIINEINSGLNILTFFGHGSLNIIDIDIGRITDLSNKDKYPLMYFNGCNVGNISADITGGSSGSGINGATYVNAPNAGALCWLAHSNTSEVGYLVNQTSSFYKNTFIDAYGASIGEIVQKTLKQSQINGDPSSKAHCYQMILLGDPAAHLYTPQLSDYEVGNTDLFFTPLDFTAVSDSFAFTAIVRNKGKATGDQISFQITRTLPGGAKVYYTFNKFGEINYLDTFKFYIKSKDITTVGLNQFELRIDPFDSIPEYNKANNKASVTVFVPGNSLNILRPLPYSIVNTRNIDLLAQVQNLFSDAEDFEMEIDTSPAFNPLSPFYQASGTLKSNGAIALWTPALPATDSMVYFWRARLKKPVSEGGNWVSSSFIYIKNGTTGWSQSNFMQYLSGSFHNMIPDTVTREINYSLSGDELSVSAARWKHGGTGIKSSTNQSYTPFTGDCYNDMLVAMLFDKKTLNYDLESRYPYNCQAVIDYNNGGYIYPARLNYYTFPTQLASGQQLFKQFIDSLGTEVYVLVFSRYNMKPSVWDEVMYSSMEKIGSGKVRQLTNDSMAYVIIGSKGLQPGEATEDYIYNPYFGNGTYQNLSDTMLAQVKKILTYSWFEGTQTSPLIGPSVSWNKVHIKTSKNETSNSDSFRVDVLVLTSDGGDSVYYSQVRPDSIDISSIPASVYPYLKLQYYSYDRLFRTPLHLDYWEVLYESPPEGLINNKGFYSFYKSGIEEGDTISLNYAFQNVTTHPFDSVYVYYSVTDANRQVKHEVGKMYRPLAANDTLVVSEKLETMNLSGLNFLNVHVNKGMEQPEQSLANNLINIPFNVKNDQTNPLLDVYFDGIRIMNGDIVSPTPQITIVLKDENKFLRLTDTSGSQLFLKRPGSSDFEYIPYNSPQVQFITSSGNANESKIVFNPGNLSDGLYTLKIVSKDRSGNLSGSKPYSIAFNVINESTITHFVPYPNPCTSSMRFVFTVTGSDPPDQIQVKIMTVSGKVVREISAAEFGPIHIGSNASQFVWNGTDQYGDRLANGVYLYQVTAKLNGKEINHRSSALDKYFIKNTGKIYLMH